MNLAVIIPAANEEATIGKLLADTTQVLCMLRDLGHIDDYHIFVVVDHASKDKTREIVEEYAHVGAVATLVWAPENRCLADAYLAGLRAAAAGKYWPPRRENGFDLFIEMDAGFSHLPQDIHQFVTAAGRLNGCEWICAYRPKPYHWRRRLVSKLGTLVARHVLGLPLKDATSGFRGYTRRAVECLLDAGVSCHGKFYQTETAAILYRTYGMPLEVPISYNDSGNVSVDDLLDAALGTLQLLMLKRWLG